MASKPSVRSMLAASAPASAAAARGGAGASGGGDVGLRTVIERQSEARVLAEAKRMNEVAAADESAPLAEVMTEEYETPDEIWAATKLKTAILSLRSDYMRVLLPHLDLATCTYGPDAPTDDAIRVALVAGSRTYATMARSNQHKHWFEGMTDRTNSKGRINDFLAFIDIRIDLEAGRISNQEAKTRFEKIRAVRAEKEKALSKVDELREAGRGPTKDQVKAMKQEVAEADRLRRRATRHATRRIPAADLERLREACAAKEGTAAGTSKST